MAGGCTKSEMKASGAQAHRMDVQEPIAIIGMGKPSRVSHDCARTLTHVSMSSAWQRKLTVRAVADAPRKQVRPVQDTIF